MPDTGSNPHDFVSSVWLRPQRERRGQPTLSREQIVGAAIELLDADGMDGLSMRRLGAKLDAGATSLYWHVANKDDLLELAADQVMGEIEIPDADRVGWREATGQFVRGFRSMILRHRWISGLFGLRPLLGPNSMRMSDRLVAVLTAAGLGGEDLASASSLLMAHAVGSATLDVAVRTATDRSGKSAEELARELEPYVTSTATEYPHYEAWWKWWRENRADLDMAAYYERAFEFGLERVLDGIESWIGQRVK